LGEEVPYRIFSRIWWCDYRRGLDWVVSFINHFYTPLLTTSNYSAVANPQTLQTTTAPAKSFPDCCVLTSRSLATASNSGDSSASRAQVLLSQPPVQNSCQLSSRLQRHLFSSFLAELNCIADPQRTRCHLFSVPSAKVKVRVKVKATLRLAVYRQSVRFGVKPLETHDQRLLSPTEPLR
jgi:hypothetical protein